MKVIILTLLVLFATPLLSQQNQPTHIPNYPISPTIDGDLSDPIWQKISPFGNFYNHFPIDNGLADNQTEVKVFHNQEFIFIGVVYHDSQARNNVSSLKRDVYNEAFFLSDCFGVIIDPFAEGDNGYFFGLNASGVQYDALIGNINNLNESWNAIWRGNVSQQGNDKFYEIAIPLDAINFNPQTNDWGIQFFINDTKLNQFSTLVHSTRNYTQYDLRFTQKVTVEDLPNKVSRKFSVVPSLAWNRATDKLHNTKNSQLIPSLDGQYNITSSLRLDATLNPDFSQVEVDQQVTNLTRFAINFPERRKFFLENSDLFTNLGTFTSNPFYSRRIGSESDILFGAKLSGNLGTKTRIGLLNVQTKSDGETSGKNYSTLVGRQNLSNALIATAFLVNSQQESTFNRIAGTNLNYRSNDKKWRGNVNYAKAFTKDIKGENNFINTGIAYQTRTFNWNVSYQQAEKNYISDVGFVPLLYNYDAATQQTTREGFRMASAEVQLKHYPKNSNTIDWIRRFWVDNVTIFNADNSLRENTVFFSPFAIRFKNRSYVYAAFLNKIEHLQYNFDFLQNGNFISPDNYNFTYGRIGYWSPTNRKLYYQMKFEYGQFYQGTRLNPQFNLSYRMIPRAVLSASYEINAVNLNSLGKKTFHLAKITSEIYFNNRLNWTTYLQYNTQRNNFNINSRIQWEYKPLSYIYLVLSNNYDNDLVEKNWGVSFKINRRLDF